ncbi:hypothetical protein ACIQI7_00545 [Kitasatospora sp. NPDC092039]|uniref:hypothetical protein n=1 Tax=Kitasatospora sp. NPDC092039 TaxID=3364086 RepID=UPI003812391E
MTDRTASAALVAAGAAAVFAAVSVAAARACRCPVPGAEGALGAGRRRPVTTDTGTALSTRSDRRCTPPNHC